MCHSRGSRPLLRVGPVKLQPVTTTVETLTNKAVQNAGPPEMGQPVRTAESRLPQPHNRRRKLRLMVFLLSLACSTVALITFDYLYSAAVRRSAKWSVKPSSCRVSDPILHHALKSNCVSVEDWGRDS